MIRSELDLLLKLESRPDCVARVTMLPPPCSAEFRNHFSGSLRRFMLKLMRENRENEALGIFKRHLRMGVDEVAIALASKACLGRTGLGSQIHGFALVSGFTDCASVSNSLMSMYCKSRDLRRAFGIFHSLESPDTVSYNIMLSGFEELEDVALFARQMHSSGISFDPVTYTSVLARCADGQEFDFGFQLHCLVQKLGFNSEIFVMNSLVTMYSKSLQIPDAHKLFEEMPYKDSVSWNALLSGYAQEGNHGFEAISLFVDMVKGRNRLDHVSFTSVISACGLERNLDFGKQAQCLALKTGFETHVSVCNVLMSLYSKCELVEDAVSVFESIVNPNVVSWTTILTIKQEDAVDLFKEMVRREVSPNDVTFVGLIHAITGRGMIQEGATVHGICIRSGFLSHINVANSFITMYGHFESMECCLKVFDEVESHRRDIISWNAVISAYALNGMHHEALHALFSASRESTPNPYTFGSALHAIASSESISLKQGHRCHGYLRKLGLDTDPVVSGALLDMYAKRGSLHESRDIFNESLHKTQVAWTAIISAHSSHGDYESVLRYFSRMIEEGIRPDSIAFLSVLTSCGHNGMFDAGVSIFNSMSDRFGVEPSAEHYSCIADMLGRAGRLNEAEHFANEIPGGAGMTVLQSLLGACRIHGEVEMATRVSERLMRMEPNESGSYVLMSNLYAEKGRWDKVARMRKLMRERRVVKEVGFSWADVDDGSSSMHLHGFSSGDRSHPLFKEIYIMADLLGSQLLTRRRRNNDDDDDDDDDDTSSVCIYMQ
ncbi:hypothetical protein M569_07717 [Genlisea aurea]|uniref:Pentatricopeptide repeat-containing protein n=1 Tax=Genlisea aurea TaxID=192259 RepID=S8E444_9LAMI|nr:hypothetical protein M569_07717 [Genlisea aurea]